MHKRICGLFCIRGIFVCGSEHIHSHIRLLWYKVKSKESMVSIPTVCILLTFDLSIWCISRNCGVCTTYSNYEIRFDIFTSIIVVVCGVLFNLDDSLSHVKFRNEDDEERIYVRVNMHDILASLFGMVLAKRCL